MLYTKAQAGIKEVIMTLVIAGVIAIIGVLIFSNVSNVSGDIFPNENKYANNESVTISVTASAGHNSTLLAQSGYVTNSEIVRNNSNGYLLVRNQDYKIALLQGASGALVTRANFTLLNVSQNQSADGSGATGFNNTELDITYQHTDKSDARKLKEGAIDNTALDSFELGVIALIVLAAASVMATISMLK